MTKQLVIFRALYGTLLVLMLLQGISTTIAAENYQPKFRFEKYERFLGLGASDEAAAKRDFLQAFPVGTSLDEIDAFFQEIGGRCFTLPNDRPGRLICGYAHPKFRLLPFLPVSSTWSVDIWFKGEPRVLTRINVTAGAEGP